MSPRTATIGLFVFFLLSLLALYWGWFELNEVLRLANNKSKSIKVDTGIFYVLLGSILIPGFIMDFVGNDNNRDLILKYAGAILMIWFIASLVLANILPMWLESHVENKGYILCATRDRMSIMDRGHEVIYQLPPCDYDLLSQFEDGSTKPWEPVLYK